MSKAFVQETSLAWVPMSKGNVVRRSDHSSKALNLLCHPAEASKSPIKPKFECDEPVAAQGRGIVKLTLVQGPPSLRKLAPAA
jgi:hypothetical protein